MQDENLITKEIRSFCFYTFLISWVFWLIIILGNKYFNSLWYGESLKIFLNFIFSGEVNRGGWLIFIFYIIWRFLMIWVSFGIEDSLSIIYILIDYKCYY